VGRPSLTVPLFIYLKIFNLFECEMVKAGLLVLENPQIKYGHVDIEIRNKFSHWSFSKLNRI
jgi:hypothetical protein